MSRCVARIDDNQIEEMNLDITIRMKVSEWRALMRQMDSKWPSWEIGKYIAGVLGHVARSTQMTFTEPLHEADKNG